MAKSVERLYTAMERLYTHGGDIYRNKVRYDFSVNVNPLGMPTKSIEAAKRAVELSDRYPDYMGEQLCARLSEAEGCRAGDIILGNGAAELIYSLCQSVKPKLAIIPSPAFKEYENAASASGAEVVRVCSNERDGFAFSARKLISQIYALRQEDARLLFLCNPNNPTGRLLDNEDLRRIAWVCEEKSITLLVDECFLPFCDAEEEHTMKHELECFKHMCVLRAFTKVYAMPGLRLGYLLTADSVLREGIRRQLQPWNTSLPAQMAGLAALEEKDYIMKARRLIAEGREYLSNELSAIGGISVYKSDANFILFSVEGRCMCDRAKPSYLYDRLLERGIMIRKCNDFDGLEFSRKRQFYRIAVRSRRENEELIKAVKEVL
ncbi:MAG: aminotransferase class I/II-fold pyridoxal phosphate-dependent enzyme [Lachnospiraceae bacterium]|nr:aminotransferase class I/II-fold pyridoxal phosphate-dependent enzyme [Lachnospiraceae bacterium]